MEDFLRDILTIVTKTEELDKYNSAKNLLYVSVSRAIKTLDILYVDDIASCEEGVKSIFGNIKVYN